VHRSHISLAAVLATTALSLASSPAHAEDQTHDGFQFRGAVGVAYISDAESTNATLHGGAGALEVYLGGTPARGLVIGGFASGVEAFGPSISANGVTVTDSNEKLTMFTIGPYIDYYPHPHRGFHILGTVGFANLTASYDDGNVSTSSSATGITLGGGVGYDWWIGRDWNIGILGRFTFASTRRTVDGFSVSEDTFIPGLFFSFGYQ
jgi:hypothetical protein